MQRNINSHRDIIEHQMEKIYQLKYANPERPRTHVDIIDSLINKTMPYCPPNKIATIELYIFFKNVNVLEHLCLDPRYGLYHVYKKVCESGNPHLINQIYFRFRDILENHSRKADFVIAQRYPPELVHFENRSNIVENLHEIL